MVKFESHALSQLNDLYLKDDPEINFLSRIEEQKNSLIAIIKECQLHNRVDIEKIEFAYENAKDSVESFLNGDLKRSIELIYNTFFRENSGQKYFDALFLNNSLLYRIRKNEEDSLFAKKEMFHIPFEKRHIISNQRFSISGFPCLYAGSSIYGCWLETDRPKLNTVNVVALKNNRCMRFLDLTIPKFISIDNIEKKIYHSVLAWLCSFKAKEKSASFIVEYIIPQNVMVALLVGFKKYRDNPEYHNVMGCDGICYTSSFYDRNADSLNDETTLKNFVLPIYKNSVSGLCPSLCEAFSVSETASLKSKEIEVRGIDLNTCPDKNIHLYFDSLQEILKNEIVTFSKI